MSEKIIADAIERAKSFLSHETEGYYDNFKFVETQLHNEFVYIYIEVEQKSVELRISEIKEPDGEVEDIDFYCKIEVCMYEENYEEVKTYDWTIKYFWIALLS